METRLITKDCRDSRMSQLPDAGTRLGWEKNRMRRPTGPQRSWRARWLHALATLLATATLSQAQVSQPPCTPLEGAFCSEPVGFTGGEHSVTVTAQVAGTVNDVEVLTAGVSGMDFAPGIGAMTCASATLGVGTACVESVTFTPSRPGLRTGAVVLLDANGNVLGTTFMNGTGVGGLGVPVTGNVLPVAGNGAFSGPVLDGGAATLASIDKPSGVALDGAGNLYIADQGHNRIRVVNAATGLISTFAGNGTAAFAGDGLAASNAAVSLNAPSSVALDGAGNLFIADTGNNVVRRIDGATGIISTAAGTGAEGGSGDGSGATDATLNQPKGVTVDASGNLYIADTANHRIRRVDEITGIIDTIAGDGTTNPSTGGGGYAGDLGPAAQAELNFPFAVAFDPAGNMYIPESGNNVVRVVAAINGVVTGSSIINSFAGTGASGNTGDDGAAARATLSSPSGVIADAAGNVYVADTGNASIRKVSSASGFISTIAANAVGEYVDGSGNLHPVSIGAPIGLLLDGSGNLYFADSGKMVIEEIESNFGILDFTATAVREASLSATLSATVENDGNAPLDLTAITPESDAALDAGATSCATGGPGLAVNGDCTIGAVFAPTGAGDPQLGHIDVVSDAMNSPLVIELIGNAAPANSTTTSLVSSVNPSGFGQAVTFAATVTTGATIGVPSGSVTFMDGVNALSVPVVVDASGVATLRTAALSVGVHSITASYGGDSTHFSSVSAALTQTVIEGTSTTLVSSLNPSAPGQSVTFTATVTATGGAGVPPDGAVTFTDGETTLAVVPVNGNGVETYTTSALANGLRTIVATYNGDAARQISASISNLIRQEVLVGSQVTVTSAPNPSTFGSAVVFTVRATSAGSATPTGTVKILDSGALIGTATLVGATGSGTFTTSSLTVGSHTISAAYLGDTSNTPSASAAITQVVNKVVVPAQTSTTVSATPNPVTVGSAVTLTATVQPAKSTTTLSGTVTFTDTFNGASATLGPAPLGTAGIAAMSPTLALGSHSIVASYSGDASDAGSVSAALTVTVLPPITGAPAATSTTLVSSSDPSAATSPVTFTATVAGGHGTPTGSVAFFADGAPVGTAAVNAGGTAAVSDSALAPGTHSITAVYSGDAGHATSTSLAISQVVDPIHTTTTLASTNTSGVALTATVAGSAGSAPTGTVTFMVGTSTLGSAPVGPGGAATLIPSLGAGTYIVVASYGGDAWHAASASQALTVSGTNNAFSLTVTPSSLTMSTNQNATATVTLGSNGGFSDTIALACAGLPAGVSCTFSGASVSVAAGGKATSQLTIDTGAVVAAASARADFLQKGKAVVLAGMFLPLTVFFGIVFAGQGRRHRSLFTGALGVILCGGVFLMSGCASVHLNKQPQTYVIQVTGTGVDSGVVQSQNLTLNITQ